LSEPRYSLHDFNTIPGYDPTQNGRTERDSWLPLNLADLPDDPPAPPTLGGFGIVYHGKRHVFSGPQESAKTLAAYAIGLETLRAIPNRYIAIIDFEMGRRSARTRLRELGSTQDELARILYIEPEVPATTDRISLLIALQPQIVIIDAAAGAYALQGLDDNNRGDVERFTALYTTAFFQNGIATIVLDHVVKNTETRGKYAIGSERKTGGVDVHLGFDTILPIKRGSTGLYKITTHKDRDGWHERGRLADLHLTSHPDTHTITWEWRQAEHDPEGHVQLPTTLMERVSHFLEAQDEPVTRNQIVLNVKGNAEFVRKAIDHLVGLKFVDEAAGANRARLYTATRPFIRSEWESKQESQVRPSSSPVRPDELMSGSSSSSPPYGGTNEPTDAQTHPVRPNQPDDPEVAAMLEQYGLNDSWIDELTPRENGEPPADLHHQEPT
jgi:hypothetical protein